MLCVQSRMYMRHKGITSNYLMDDFPNWRSAPVTLPEYMIGLVWEVAVADELTLLQSLDGYM